MTLTRTQIIIIGIAGIIVLFFILVFLGLIPGLKKPGSNGFLEIGGGQQIDLYFWGVSEANPNNAINALINEYSKTNPNIRINYQQFDDANSYEKALLNALAAFRAPDIIMFHNSWLAKHYDKVSPLSETFLPLAQFQQLFPYVAEQDFVLNQRVYSLPLYIDTLALLYNKDIFDAKAIALLPTTWSQFQNLVPQLKSVNQFNQIIGPAAAIGGSEKSIHSSSNLLNLLMMQFGSQMVDQYGRINFGSAGLQALNFYIQFANPSSPYYTWNDNFTYSLDNFSQGSTAIIFDYASQIPLIKNKNPYLRIGVAPMPQPAGTSQPIKDYANYWGLSVSSQSQKVNLAWNFALYATANPQASEIYLQAAKKPPALKSLIEKYKNDPEIGVFARQALTARSWRQPDSAAVKQIFSNIIESVLTGRLNSEQALRQAENEINEL
jgi:ABC-type glycerol-3-phosphate transport system substrate-binding protein